MLGPKRTINDGSSPHAAAKTKEKPAGMNRRVRSDNRSRGSTSRLTHAGGSEFIHMPGRSSLPQVNPRLVKPFNFVVASSAVPPP
jgi:hypothetical protein